ncbi:MAG: hypothetical protein Q4D48_08030, partial [Coriobacteriales bacterium]|nr:hypothetical protein [Coriobacteriales bacterium]
MVRNRKWWGVGLLALLAAMLVFALAPTQALAKTGWVKQSNGKYRYYSNDSSYFSDATYLINNKYYGFDKNGYRRKGWYEETMTWTDENGTKHTSSNWLYFGEKNDAASVGWKMIGGKWYWFEDGKTESGTPYIPYMASDGTRMIGKKNYLFNKSGALVTNGWYKSVWTYGSETYTNWYWADSNGVCPIGWKKISGTWYYFWDWGGMASNT